MRIFATTLCLTCLAFGAQAAETIQVDGSSTVYPISNAMAQLYKQVNSKVDVEVKFSGTSAGMRRFVAGEIPITGASRPIKSSEIEKCQARGIDFIELPVAMDGITVVVNRDNSFIDHLTVDELKALWRPDSTVSTWADLRRGWPNEKISLWGAGTDSGTFEYFTKAIVGKAHASRADYHPSEDDNELVQGVVADRFALGYFGFAYYLENQSLLRAVPIKAGGTAVEPSHATILNASYQPLSRPIFIYVNKAELNRPEVREFVRFYLNKTASTVETVGYVSLGATIDSLAQERFALRTTGSMFAGGRRGSLAELMASNKTSAPAQDASTAQPIRANVSAPVPRLDAKKYQAEIDDLRDACLALTQVSLTTSANLGDVQGQLTQIQARIDHLVTTYGATTALDVSAQ